MPKYVDYSPSEDGINFTNRSQGFTSPLEVVGKTVSGLAKTGSLFLDAKRKEDTKNLIKDADTAADSLLTGVPTNPQPFATNPESGARPGSNGDMPAGLVNGMNDFNRYAKAYSKSGAGGDLDIYSKMVNAAKKLKAKYPGHVEDVDNLIQSALNSKPANTIRKELNSLLDAEMQKQAAGADNTTKFYRNWAIDNGKYLESAGIDPNSLDFSNENQMRTVWNHVSKIQGDDLETQRTKNRLELDATVGQVDTKKFKTLAATEIGNKIDQSLRAGSPLFDEFMKQKTAATGAGGPGGIDVTPEEQQQLSQAFGAISSQMQLEANALVNGEFYLKGMPSKSDREDVLSAVNSRLSVYQDMLDNKMYGLFNGVNNQIKSKYDHTELDTLNGKYGDYTKIVLQATKNGIPLDAIDAALVGIYGDAGLADLKLKAARQYVTTGIVTGAIPNAGEAISDAGKDGVTDPAFYRKTLADIQFVLTDPNQDPKVVENTAKSVYQSKNNDVLLKQFGGNSQRQVFNQMTDPRIFARLKGTETYKLAEEWTKNQFVQLNKQGMDALVEKSDGIGKGFELYFDDKTSTIQIIATKPMSPGAPGRAGGSPDTIAQNKLFNDYNAVKGILGPINADLAKVHKIVAEGDSGLSPSEETKLLLNLSGFNRLPEEVQKRIFNGPEVGKVEPTARSVIGASHPDIQAADDFLASVSTKTKDAIVGLDDNFSKGLAGLLQAAPPEIRDGLGVFSAKRSREHQKELWNKALIKYGTAEEARKWVAPPGNSRHEIGMAADLSYMGKSLAKAPADVVRWLHDNAAQFGLVFPLGNESWHVELAGTRKKK